MEPNRDKELREIFSKLLDAPYAPTPAYSAEKRQVYSWEEIFCELGKLKERAEKPPVEPLNPNLHFHPGIPCYQDPCVW